MSARANPPEVAKAIEELDAQTSQEAGEMEEPVAQEEGETHHTRRKGPHAQKEDRERRSTTRAEASTLANPDEFRIEEDTAGEGRQEEKKTKARKGPTETDTKSSRSQGTNGRIVPREEEAPPSRAHKRSVREGAGKGGIAAKTPGGPRPGRPQPSSWNREVASREEGATRAPGRPRPGGASTSASSEAAIHKPPPSS